MSDTFNREIHVSGFLPTVDVGPLVDPTSPLFDFICDSADRDCSQSAFLDRFSELLNLGGDLNIPDPVRGHPILALIVLNLRDEKLVSEALRIAISKGASPDARSLSGDNALHAAIRVSNVPGVVALLKEGANPDAVSGDGATCVDLACETLRYPEDDVDEHAPMEVFRALMNAGAAVPKPVLPSVRPYCLILVAGGNDFGVMADLSEAVELLLQGGADAAYKEQSSLRQALHYAAMRGYWRTAAALIRYGAPLQDADVIGLTPSGYVEQGPLADLHQLRAVFRSAEMQRIVMSSKQEVEQI